MNFTNFSIFSNHTELLCVQTPSFVDQRAFNIAFHTGDNPKKVLENRVRLADALGLSLDSFCFGEQTHEANIRIVKSSDAGAGAKEQKSAFCSTDAMATNESGIFLLSMTADCAAVAIFDPVNCAVAVAHAGWKGTAKRIVPLTIERMSEEFGSLSQDLLVAIGAAIKGCCYEVGEEVVRQISDTIEGSDKKEVFRELRDGKYSLDIQEALKQQLLAVGVRSNNIEISQRCTHCEDSMFSYRKDRQCGRFGMVIGLRKATS